MAGPAAARAVGLHAAGVTYAAAIGAALWWFWPDARDAVANVVGGDYRHVIVPVYVVAGLRIAEWLWETASARLFPGPPPG